MQKFPLRSQINRQAADGGDHKRAIKRNTIATANEMPPQRTQKVCQRIAAGVVKHHPSFATMHPSTSSVRICFRTPSKNLENVATWDEIGCGSKSLPSPVSSSMMVESTSVPPAVIAATTQEPVQQTSAGILEVPCNGTASSRTNNTTTTTTSNSNANGNKNKDGDDNAGSHSQQQQQRITLAAGAVPPTMPAASAREFMTFERLRLGDQINFLLFDPYRTLKFLITELKSRLRTVVPDDINVQKILVEIQQTMKRIRVPTASEPLPFQPRPTIVAKGVAAVMEKPVECILPKERCHVIKGGPLINHAKRVNSFCQTMEPQLANVSVCQMCEHQVKQGAAGCNQKRMNGNSDAEGDVLAEVDVVTGSCQRSGDHREGIEVEKHFSCKSLQDAIEKLKIKNNPFQDSDDTQKIITQLETELSNFQRELQRTSSSSSSLRIQPTRKNLKVQCKRQLNEDAEEMEAEKGIEEKPSQEEETFPDFIAQLQRTPSAMHGKKLDFSNQASATAISKESQTNLKDPTQIFCQLEKEKLLLLQQFRASEMQNIQADLNELHALIKDQLDGIFQSVTRENLNLKYHHSSERGNSHQSKKNRNRQKNWFAEKTPVTGRRLPSSSSSLTGLTSSVLSLTKVGVSSEISTDSLEKQKKPSKQPPPTAADNRSANNTKSMMKQKSSSSSLSTVADAKEHHDISDIDKANKALVLGGGGRKKSKNQHNLFIHPNDDDDDDGCADAGLFAETPHCNGKKCNTPAVECEGCSHCCCPHTGMDRTVHRIMTTDADRTATHCNIKSTKKTSLAAMACHKHRQQCHQQPSSTRTTPTVQLISSSLAVPLERPSPCTVMQQSAADEAAPKLDAVTNAAIRTIMENAYATRTATAAAEHSNGIRMRAHCQCLPTHNSWQRVSLKNPTGCQLKKQICGDRYERTIINTSSNNKNDDDNRSNSSDEIHQDCQKCRSRSINPFCGLHSDEMHEAGADNAAATTDAAVSFSCRRRALSAHDRDDGGAGGDGPIYWDKGNRPAIRGDFTCHRRQPKQTRELVPSTAPKAAFQMDFGEFKEFLDEITDLTPRLEKTSK